MPVQLHLTVHTPNAFVILGMTGLTQQQEQLPEAKPRMRLHLCCQCLDNRPVIRALRNVATH